MRSSISVAFQVVAADWRPVVAAAKPVVVGPALKPSGACAVTRRCMTRTLQSLAIPFHNDVNFTLRANTDSSDRAATRARSVHRKEVFTMIDAGCRRGATGFPPGTR